jgi:hypothetical protein
MNSIDSIIMDTNWETLTLWLEILEEEASQMKMEGKSSRRNYSSRVKTVLIRMYALRALRQT